ncbi:lysosomal Pro-X carboxypeptidase [Teleopsis dalmanni]|uniref:lysosomal Pro-X carboxypeptidase n=1 Tax=Teleopsis dalmanni TaxID=139649 RepID=UPI0018CCF82F|nr:lysosomal Pro-X carboxypeptidase [Teleopsis dalmanni]
MFRNSNISSHFWKIITFLILISQFWCATPVHVEKRTTQYEIRKFRVPVDHFNLVNNKTFDLRYLYNDTFADKSDSAPIFFYTGNEGDIELFAKNTGFMWELAENLRASVIFAEHRYYGKSLPFGDNTFNDTSNLGYLSVEQVLEDYGKLIQSLLANHRRPVIAFGGSYGGMLAAWMRMKYPHIIEGALAASAPILQFNGITPCDIFSKITTSIYTSYSKNCSTNIKNSWNLFRTYFSKEDGKKELNAVFKFCDPLKQEEDLNHFLDYLNDVYENLAMANYPYENDFLSPLPANPVYQFCTLLEDLHVDKELLLAMHKAISVYTNFTTTLKCLDYKSAFDTTLGGMAWDIQTCNQLVLPMCSNTKDTMFPNAEWNFSKYSDDCYKNFKIRPELNDITFRYGGKNLKFTSNIIFSNGLLDPWSGGGVLETANNDLNVIIIPEGAHHLDLRSSNPADPPSVQAARKEEERIIKRWIRNYY